MGAAGSDVRCRPSRPSPDMVTACCIARKGNFRTGPSLNAKMELIRLPQALEDTSSDDERGLIPLKRKAKVMWRSDRFLEERYEILESGDDWTEARRSEDINFTELPEVGVARKMTFNKEANSSARQRAARRKGKESEADSPPKDSLVKQETATVEEGSI